MKSANRINKSINISTSDLFEKFATCQKELELNLTKAYQILQEIPLYVISKNSFKNADKCILHPLNNISSLNKGPNVIEPDADFFIVNKATWYSLRNKISYTEKPLKKLGYFCNRKLVVVFDDLCYFFYKDKTVNRINEGYFTFSKGQNPEDIIYALQTLM